MSTKARKLASFDIPTRDNIHQNQCNNHRLFVILEKNMSSEKVVKEDLRKLFQKVLASYHLYIFLQLDEKILSLQHSAFFPVRTYHSCGLLV